MIAALALAQHEHRQPMTQLRGLSLPELQTAVQVHPGVFHLLWSLNIASLLYKVFSAFLIRKQENH